MHAHAHSHSHDTPAHQTSRLPLLEQDWASYTPENHEVWGLLYARRMKELRVTGSEAVLEGVDAIGLREDAVPDLRDVNARLSSLTGWAAVPVAGFLPAEGFFAALAERRFPTTISVRPRAQLDYLPEPDIFHDVFGHVPLHSDPAFARFLQRIGQIASAARGPEQVEALARLFWFTVEFGLVREGGAVKIYGSGLVSSIGDAANALGASCERRAFSLDAVFDQAFVIDRLQDVLFVVDSFGELFEAAEEAAGRLGIRVGRAA